MIQRRKSLAAIALLPLCLLAACGTRVSLSSQHSSATQADSGLGIVAPAQSSAESSIATPGTDQNDVPTDDVTPSPTQTSDDGGRTSAPVISTPGTGAQDHTPISVGFVVSKINATSFVPGLSTGDQEQQAKIVVANINATGGLNGHPIAANYYGVSATAATTWGQDACASFTQDHHSRFVIANAGDPAGLLAPCLAKAGVSFIDDGYAVDSSLAKSIAGHMYLPGGWVEDRLMRTQLAALKGQGFLKAGDKVGVLLYDDAISHRVLSNVVLPGLAAMGIKDVQTAATPSGSALNMSGPALKFKASGVTRVICIEFSPLFFMTAAQQQGYHPRYAVYSNFGPAVLLQSSAPKQQLHGAGGFGFSPQYDVDTAHSPGPVSANETRCFTAMKQGGADTSTPTIRALVLWFCDAGFFLQAAVKRSGDVSTTGLSAGARALTDYRSAVTFRSDLTSGRPDGASAYRDLAFKDDCSCFQYTSGLKPATA